MVRKIISKLKIKRKYFIITTILITVFTLTGCGKQLYTFQNTNAPEQMQARVAKNRELAKKMKSAGFLSEEKYTAIDGNLELQSKRNAKILSSEDDSADNLDSFVRAISFIRCGNNEVYGAINNNNDEHWDLSNPGCAETKGSYTDACLPVGHTDEIQQVLFSNFLIHGYDGEGHTNPGGGQLNNYRSQVSGANTIPIKASDIDPIPLICEENEKAIDAINECFRVKVRILKPNALSETELALDEVVAKVKAAAADANNPDMDTLDTYFEDALDENGDPIYLWDIDNKPLIGLSDANPGGLGNPVNELGYDTPVYQFEKCLATIRCVEFIQKNVDEFEKFIGANEDRWFVITPSRKGDTYAYLMEYPVYKLDKLTNNGDTADTVNAKFAKSALGINIKTGKMIKYNVDSSDKPTSFEGENIDSTQYYLTIGSAENNDDEKNSSFIVNGTGDITLKGIDKPGKKSDNVTLTVPRIILRDYLEATYAPEFTSDSDVVIFGRKLRIDFKYNNFKDDGNYTFSKDSGANEAIAKFVDINGNEVSNSPTIKITDITNANALLPSNNSNAKLVTIAPKNTASYEVPAKETSGTKKITDLKHKFIGYDNTTYSIHPTLMFPGHKIGKDDFSNDSISKQRFYVITVQSGLFDTALYSSWIASTTDKASLEWWNKYLDENGFVYKIDSNELDDYLANNYKYELNGEGVIILDLETISKIQDEMDKKDADDRAHFVRTFFIVLGWIIIIYTVLCALAWIIDTNIDFGIKFLEKLSFGHWIAIKYEEDIPIHDDNNSKYIGQKEIVIKCIVLLTFSIIITNIDVYEITLKLIRLFGKLAIDLEKLVKGYQ